MINFLKKPKAVVFAFILSAIIAIYLPQVAKTLEKPGDMYLAMLQMCVMPLLMVSIIGAIARVVSTKTNDNTTLVFLMKYTGFAFVLVVMAILIAEVFKAGYPIADNPDFLQLGSSGENSQPIFVTVNDPLEKTQSIVDLFRSIFTNNIFVSLKDSLILQVILFSVFVGAAAGHIEDDKKKVFLDFIDAGNAIFKRLIGWITAFLPLGIICIFSFKFLNFSPEIFSIFLNAMIILLSSMFFIIFVLNLFIAKKLGIGYFKVFSHIKEVLVVSASTGSPIATMPTYMKALSENLNFDREKVDLFVPLSIALYRFGNVFYFGFVAVLTAQIFAIPLGLYEYINVVVLVFFAGFAAVSSGIVNIGMLAMILSPIGVPSSLAITLFSAIDPIIDPIRTMFTMYINLFCATFSLVTPVKQLTDK